MALLLVSERPVRSPSNDSLLMSDHLIECLCGPSQGLLFLYYYWSCIDSWVYPSSLCSFMHPWYGLMRVDLLSKPRYQVWSLVLLSYRCNWACGTGGAPYIKKGGTGTGAVRGTGQLRNYSMRVNSIFVGYPFQADLHPSWWSCPSRVLTTTATWLILPVVICLS